METIGYIFGIDKVSTRQPLPYEKILETRSVAKVNLKEFLIKCSKKIKGIKFEIGQDKNLDVAERKAIRDYGGDKRAVTDYVRAKISVNTPDQVRALKSEEFEDVMKENEIHIVQINDYFSDPKDRTGYRCLNYKLAIPVGKDEQDDEQYHYVELQIIAEQLEAVYDETHIYKRRAEEAEDQIATFMIEHGIYDLKNRELSGEALSMDEKATLRSAAMTTKPFRKISMLNYASCYLINATAARGSGEEYDNYEILIDEDKRGKHQLSPQREERLETMRHKADMLNLTNE